MPQFLAGHKFDDPLFILALILIAGIVGGEIFARLRLPKVTGWIATGILLRELFALGEVAFLGTTFDFDLFGMNTDVEPRALNVFRPFMNFVLGFIAFTVGATLYFASLRNTGKRIGLLLLSEALLTPLIVFLIMFYAGSFVSDQMSRPIAILLAAIAIAGAPGTTALVIQESRARGILTKTLIAAIGLIDMVAVGVFVFLSTILAGEGAWLESLGEVGTQFLVTFLIGGAFSCLALLLTRTIVSPAFLGPSMVAVILGSWGAASAFGTSGGILACTFAGIVVTNLRHDTVRSAEAYLSSIGGVLFAIFFTLAGMRLDFGLVPKASGLVALFFVARFIAKSTSAYSAMSLAGAPTSVRNYLGISLLPHGGVAVGLILLVQSELAFENIEGIVTTVGLAALAINQLIGPSATRFALTQAGEAHKDRPRLLDFLQEQRIMVGLTGKSREEVVRNLSNLLYATSNMTVPQEEFVESVLKRDREETTCLGRGLMIPHAILAEGDQIRGVLGLSEKGLKLGAPDDRLVHAVLLLATPELHRNRHLQVISAFATAITRDDNLSEQLYHARSAAHAYNVLHANDQEDINYFLEDAAERVGLREEELSAGSAEDNRDPSAI